MSRFPLRTAMVFIAACAIGLSVLTGTDEVRKRGFIVVTLAALFAGLFGAAVLRGPDQRWCIKFSAFWGAYLLVSATYMAALLLFGCE